MVRKFFTAEQSTRLADPRDTLNELVQEECMISIVRWSPPELAEQLVDRAELIEKADRFEEWWVWEIDGLPTLGWPDDEEPWLSEGMFHCLWWCPPSPEAAAEIEATLRGLGAREPNEWIAEALASREANGFR